MSKVEKRSEIPISFFSVVQAKTLFLNQFEARGENRSCKSNLSQVSTFSAVMALVYGKTASLSELLEISENCYFISDFAPQSWDFFKPKQCS